MAVLTEVTSQTDSLVPSDQILNLKDQEEGTVGPFSYSSFQSTIKHQPSFIKGSNTPYFFVHKVKQFPRPELLQHPSNELEPGNMIPFHVSFVPNPEEVQNAGYIDAPKWTRFRYWSTQKWEEHDAFQLDERVLPGTLERASSRGEEGLFNMSGTCHQIVANEVAPGVVKTKYLTIHNSEAYHHAHRKCPGLIKSPAHAAVLGFAAHFAKQKKRKRKTSSEKDRDGGADVLIPAPKRIKAVGGGLSNATNKISVASLGPTHIREVVVVGQGHNNSNPSIHSSLTGTGPDQVIHQHYLLTTVTNRSDYTLLRILNFIKDDTYSVFHLKGQVPRLAPFLVTFEPIDHSVNGSYHAFSYPAGTGPLSYSIPSVVANDAPPAAPINSNMYNKPLPETSCSSKELPCGAMVEVEWHAAPGPTNMMDAYISSEQQSMFFPKIAGAPRDEM